MSARCGWRSVIRAAQGAVEGVDRSVSLRDPHVALAVDPDLDRRLGLYAPVLALLGHHPKALELKQRLVLARLAAQQQLERGVGGLVVVAAVLTLLEPFQGPLRNVVVDFEPRRLGSADDRALARQLRDQHVATVADQLRIGVLEGAHVGAHPGDVHAALVRERVSPHIGLVRVRHRIADLVDVVSCLGQGRELFG